MIIDSFAAQKIEEPSFVRGKRLEILYRSPADPDWCRAQNTNGSIGFIPQNQVQVLFRHDDNDWKPYVRFFKFIFPLHSKNTREFFFYSIS